MFKSFIPKSLLLVAMMPLAASAQLTLEHCQKMARDNYPLLKQYCLIKQTTAFTVSNIEKGYLPQISVSGQASYQSDVATLPDVLSNMLASNGYDVKGLEKDQYRIGLDVNQLILDGGSISAQAEVAERDMDVQTAQTDVDLYALNERVNDLFFGVLLIEDKLQLNEELQRLLQDNCRKLEAMLAGGTAMQADVDAVKAEFLTAVQQKTELQSMETAYRKMLAIFIGMDVDKLGDLQRPEADVPLSLVNNRPELKLFSAQKARTEAQRRQIDAGLKPKLSLFAQGYYGYTGYDMFNDMFDHDWTLNGIIGLKLTWNLSNFYTQKNDRHKLDLAQSRIDMNREVFLLNDSMATTQEMEAVGQYHRMMVEDDAIIKLRTSVREAAEAKLEHGVIDVNNLLQEINRENTARLNRSSHEIEMLKHIYELKHTINQ